MDPLRLAKQELRISETAVSKAGVALKKYPESDDTLKRVSWTYEQPPSKTDTSFVCVLRPLFAFCVLRYVRHDGNVRRDEISEKCHMEIIDILPLKTIFVIPQVK